MIYQYSCPKCLRVFDVVKSVHAMNDPESCKCGTLAVRDFVPTRLHLVGTSVQHPEYNPGLGCVVNNKKHRAELCKANGLEEVGSEPVESLHKYNDTKRQEKLENAYEEATRGWVGSGDIIS